MENDKEKDFVGYQIKLLKLEIQNLREMLAKDIANLKENAVLLEKMDEQKATALKLALDNKAAEYEVHFDDLNHEADQLKEMQAKYTPRESFDKFVEAYEEFKTITRAEFAKIKESIENELRKIREEGIGPLKGLQDTQKGRSSITTLITAAIVSVLVALAIFFIINWFKK